MRQVQSPRPDAQRGTSSYLRDGNDGLDVVLVNVETVMEAGSPDKLAGPRHVRVRRAELVLHVPRQLAHCPHLETERSTFYVIWLIIMKMERHLNEMELITACSRKVCYELQKYSFDHDIWLMFLLAVIHIQISYKNLNHFPSIFREPAGYNDLGYGH